MEISIIVPCRNEGANVEILTNRILRAVPGDVTYEIVFVDDSSDDTPERLDRMSRQFSFVRYLHRENGGGLSSAILEGCRMAKGDWFIVMDADLQHPPESLPALIEEIRSERSEVIVPSRFIPGGSDGGLNAWRRLVSWTARMMARLLIRKVWKVTDPTSGYFAVRRDVAFSRPLQPIGWKILLELLVRSDYSNVREIPYSFHSRDLGSSKLNLKEQWNYIRHLGRLLRSSESDMRFWIFCAVGLSGVAVNTLVYVLLVHLGVPIGFSFAGATIVATFNNFTWNNLLTWKDSKSDKLWYRIFKFSLVSLSGLCLSSFIVTCFHSWFGVHYLVAGLIGILVSTGSNFALNNVWTFKKLPAILSPISKDPPL
ncbi:glycosyltransferase [Cohnella faecalis]